MDRKLEYQMANALPFMLWDCAYAYADLDVTWKMDDNGTGSDLHHRQLHSIPQRSLILIVLDKHFITAAPQYHSPPP